MTGGANQSLTAQFLMDALPGARHSKGPLYSERELGQVVEILTADGYRVHNHMHAKDENPFLLLVKPGSDANGYIDVVHIFLHNGNSDKRWSGGMMVFGKVQQGSGFQDVGFESCVMLWDFLKSRRPSGMLDRVAGFLGSLKP